MSWAARQALVGLLAAGLGAAALVGQGAGAHDEARAAWQYRRAVQRPEGGAAEGRFVAIAIPPDVADRSQPGLQDLRLVADDGREVPFVLDVDVPRTAERRRSGRLVEAQQERKRVSAWVVDFGTAAPFDRLEIDIDGRDFSKRVEVETSADGQRWTRIGETWLFDRPWRGRQVHDTDVERAEPLTARYVRLTIDDWRSTPVIVRGVTAVLTTHLGGRRWTREAPLVKLDTPAGHPSRYRVDLPPGVPVERITIAADDGAFWRDARVFEELRGQPPAAVSPTTPIYRLRLDDADLDAERRDIDLARPVAGPLVVEIEDRDSPPLTRPRVTLSGVERRVLVPPTEGGLTLYYGNAATRRPNYDLDALRTRLALAGSYPRATLGPEAVNPRFAPLPPMAFLPARGAEAETSRWAVSRALRVEGRDDVYTLTLAPQDVAYLRDDLGDLRLVDANRRQVPYVLEPRAVAARVALTAAAGAVRPTESQVSAWTLSVPEGGPETPVRAPLPLSELALTFADAFYTRPATLLVPDRRAPHGQRVVLQDTLRAARREAGAAPEPHTLPVGDLRTGTLALEVRDGDNAPLRLTAAEAVVWVPRITFKAGGGEYRLLLGNPDAAPPTYDLAALRQDVLAYSAIPLDPRALQPAAANADYVRGASDLAEGLARWPLLWGILGVSIAALLWLTRVILKTPPSA